MKKIINIAVIGCSGMAKGHMEGVIANENAKLYAVCDKYEDLVEEAKKEFEVSVGTTNYLDLVNDENVDAVILVTPDKLHRPMTEAFLRAGKAVLCEKPMALSVEECRDMIEVEKETNGFLMIGQVCRFTPAFKKAKELISEGKIGELCFVESEYAHCYEKARGKDDWRVDPDRHGFIGGGCHAVDLLRWIAGNPTEVYSLANHKLLPDWPVNDTAVAVYKFPNDVMGKVFVSIGCRRNYTMRSVFYGTKGTIICDNKSDNMQLFTVKPDDENGYTEPEIIPVDIKHHNVGGEIEMFVDALLTGKPSPLSSAEGAATVSVCVASVESAKEGKPLEIKYL